MKYKIFVESKAQKEIAKLNLKDQYRVTKKIDQLGSNPRPGGKNFRPLKEYSLYRIRVGNLRIIYSIDDETMRVIIEKVRRKGKKTYKGLW